MKNCPQEVNVERMFDGAEIDSAPLRAHLDTCPSCRAHLTGLERMRAGFTARQAAPEIADAQLPAFLRQLQDRVEAAPAARPYRIWAMLSGAAAALVVTVSVISIVSTGPKPIEATVIEQRSTEIQGATTAVTVADDGTTTVWVHVPEGDMW